MKLKSGLVIGFISTSLLLTGCSSEQNAVSAKKSTAKNTPTTATTTTTAAATTSTANVAIPKAVQKPLKLAAIMEFSTGTFSSQYIQGVKDQVQALGGSVQVYNADNDLSKMASNLDTAINQHVDGILIDHGRADALKDEVTRATKAGIPVVAFDDDLNLPGVTVIDQDDYSMAWSVLKTLGESLNAKGNIVYINTGGFTPLERRDVIYQAFKKRYPAIHEIAHFGTVNDDTALETQSQMEAILKRFPKGKIDAVFAPYDEFAKGAAKAIQQAGRTEIKVYGIDLSDEDLQLIQDKSDPWVATAATDPADIGKTQVRFLYQKIAGENTPAVYSIEPHLVTRTDLPNQTINMSQLSKFIPGWTATTAATDPWMAALAKKGSK
ncbi:MAG TPA: sugar ABC transporter substrate-binding protein [Candidatus Angelobacter sp.]|nr:sugar ABC transporter substrate-binding protein [Candidatus Angelobacter sp.]